LRRRRSGNGRGWGRTEWDGSASSLRCSAGAEDVLRKLHGGVGVEVGDGREVEACLISKSQSAGRTLRGRASVLDLSSQRARAVHVDRKADAAVEGAGEQVGPLSPCASGSEPRGEPENRTASVRLGTIAIRSIRQVGSGTIRRHGSKGLRYMYP
jgi:hypothetical protein